METTNSEMPLKAKITNFLNTAFEIAVEIGENEVSIKTFDGCMRGEIQTKKDFYLKKVQDIAGDIDVSIGICDYGLSVNLWQKL